MKKLISISLALLLLICLTACGGEPTAPPDTSEPPAATDASELTDTDMNADGMKNVTVSTIAELASAIGNDTRIILKEGRYNFSELQNKTWENKNMEVDSYFDGYDTEMLAYRISGVSNLTIEAEPGVEVEIVTEVAITPVLYFEYCSNIIVKGLLCGHAVEPGYCTGGVIEADNCKNIDIEGCRLYGSGTFGVEAYNCMGVDIKDTQIYECTYGIMNFSQVIDVVIQGCVLYNNTGNDMLSFYDCWDVLAEDCRIYDNVGFAEDTPFIVYDGSTNILFSNCEFADNFPEVDTTGNDCIAFERCTVSPLDDKSVGEHFGYASVTEELYEDGDILIDIDDVVWIDSSDDDLMQKYGISYEDMTNDFAIVDEEQIIYLYRGRRDSTSFSILTPDPTYGHPINTEVSGDEFVDAVNSSAGQEILVVYTLDENEDPSDRILASIAQMYVP